MKRVCQLCVPPRVIDAALFEAHRQAHKNVEQRARHDQRYGPEHRRERARWLPLVEKGTVVCARCEELILPGEEWHLGHDDNDPTGRSYAGPEHQHCSQRTAAHRRDRERAS